MNEIQVSQLMQMGIDDVGPAATKFKSFANKITVPIALHEVQANELYRTYVRRLRHLRRNGGPESLDLESFVDILAEIDGSITVFSVLEEGWAFVGFLDPSGREKWGAVAAVRRRTRDR